MWNFIEHCATVLIVACIPYWVFEFTFAKALVLATIVVGAQKVYQHNTQLLHEKLDRIKEATDFYKTEIENREE